METDPLLSEVHNIHLCESVGLGRRGPSGGRGDTGTPGNSKTASSVLGYFDSFIYLTNATSVSMSL